MDAQEPHKVSEKERSSTCTSSGSFKFYREFDGTTSAKLSQASKTGHQGILVTPRVIINKPEIKSCRDLD